jgi:dTDP-4-dehydrorhamnose 3,5-epimerase
VRCTRGAILDVIVDLRPESPTYLRHTGVELTADNRRGLFVPRRFAHGYQVLEDQTEVTYLVGEFYTPVAEGGLPYNDPRLAIAWPLPVRDVSEKDRRWPAVDAVEPEIRRRMTVAAGVSAP